MAIQDYLGLAGCVLDATARRFVPLFNFTVSLRNIR